MRAVRNRYPHKIRILTQLSLTSKNRQERDTARSSTSNELQSPKCDLFAASRLLNCSILELRILRRSLNSVLVTAAALAESWSSSFHFQQKRPRKIRREVDELSFDERLIDPEKAVRVHVFTRQSILP